MKIVTVITGALARDAKLQFTQNGNQLVRFSIPINYGWGENQKTTWANLSWFGDWAEKKFATGKMTKGALVQVIADYAGIYVPQDGGDPSLNFTVREYAVIRNSDTVMAVAEEDDSGLEDWDDDSAPF